MAAYHRGGQLPAQTHFSQCCLPVCALQRRVTQQHLAGVADCNHVCSYVQPLPKVSRLQSNIVSCMQDMSGHRHKSTTAGPAAAVFFHSR